jgi:outer membrane protein assembly factor BamB
MPLQPRWIDNTPAQPRTAWAGQDELNREGIIMVERVKFDDALHVAVVNDRLYFGSSVDHKVHCLQVAAGTELRSFCTGGPVRLAPTVYADRVFFGAADGYAYCLDARAGRLSTVLRTGPSGTSREKPS